MYDEIIQMKAYTPLKKKPQQKNINIATVLASGSKLLWMTSFRLGVNFSNYLQVSKGVTTSEVVYTNSNDSNISSIHFIQP